MPRPRTRSTAIVSVVLAVMLLPVGTAGAGATASTSARPSALPATVAVTSAAGNELITMRADGAPTRRNSQIPRTSPDGAWVTFSSSAIGLIDGMTLHGTQVYRRATATGELTLVSVALDGGGGTGKQGSYESAISDDGNLVAFGSHVADLVADPPAVRPQVYLRDIAAGTTTLLVHGLGGSDPDGFSELGGMSAGGNVVLLTSEASNLVAGDDNGMRDVFVLDRSTGTTTLVSRGTDGKPANGRSYATSLSADGRLVAFESDATNLVAGDTNRMIDLFLHDVETGETTLISRDADGGPANKSSFSASLSRDGRHVVYSTFATDIVPGGGTKTADIVLQDLVTGDATLVSVAAGGGAANGDSITPSITDDAGTVAFRSAATNLVAGDNPAADDIFVRTVATGATTRISVREDGKRHRHVSYDPVIAGDGGSVLFVTGSRLVPADRNGVVIDVYRWHSS